METNASAGLGAVVNAALARQQFGYSTLKQQGQTVSTLVNAAAQVAASAPAAGGGQSGRVDLHV